MNLSAIISAVLYCIAGIITLSAKEFFSYHREATGMKWEEIKAPLQMLILAVFKMAGFGIVCFSLVFLSFSILNFTGVNIDSRIKMSIPIIGLLFWVGSFAVTFKVHRKTKANTPWKGSLFAGMIVILAP